MRMKLLCGCSFLLLCNYGTSNKIGLVLCSSGAETVGPMMCWEHQRDTFPEEEEASNDPSEILLFQGICFSKCKEGFQCAGDSKTT